MRKSLDIRNFIVYIRNMKTNNRKYTTISIPKTFGNLIPNLQQAYKKETGMNVSRGETVGIAIKNELQRKTDNVKTMSTGNEECD